MIDTRILIDQLHKKNIAKLVPDFSDFKLLYRGSRDGFTHDAFHKNCDQQGPTLTIVRSNYNKIFGGFTNISWKRTSGLQKWQNQSFVFFQKPD